jgi:hypothetical protein
MLNDVPVKRIQNDCSGNWKLSNDLFQNQYAVIHYCDTPLSVNPSEIREISDRTKDDNPADSRRKLSNKQETLNDIVENGAIIAAQYKELTKKDGFGDGICIARTGPIPDTDPVGNDSSAIADSTKVHLLFCRQNEIEFGLPVPPGSTRDQILDFATDLPDKHQQSVEQVANPGSEETTDESHGYLLFKAVKLVNPTWAYYEYHPILHAKRKQGAIASWNKTDDHVRGAYAGEENLLRLIDEDNHQSETELKRAKAELLAPSQLEMLCMEYLRRRTPEYVQLLPTGSSLKDIDIFAYDNTLERHILAQVTHQSNSSRLEDKHTKLLKYRGDKGLNRTKFYFFCPYSVQELESEFDETKVDPDVTYISTAEVYTAIENAAPKALEQYTNVRNPRETPSPSLNTEVTPSEY